MKKILSVFLTVVMLVGLLSSMTFVAEASGGQSETATYSIFDAIIPFKNMVDCQRGVNSYTGKQEVRGFTYVYSAKTGSQISSLVSDVKENPDNYYFKFSKNSKKIDLTMYKYNDSSYSYLLSEGGYIQNYGENCLLYIADGYGTFVSFRDKAYHMCGGHTHEENFTYEDADNMGVYSKACILCGCGEVYTIVKENPSISELEELPFTDGLVEIDHTHVYDDDGKCPCGKYEDKAEIDNSDAGVYSDTVVEGLDDVLADNLSGDDTVSISLKVTEDSAETTEKEAIADIADGQELAFMELSLLKSVNSGTPEDIGSANDNLLTIKIPFDSTGKENITVYRYHGTAAEKLSTTANGNGEYFEVAANFVIIYAKKFSTYAIGYDAEAKYTVKFNANGGTGTMADQEITRGVATALSENTFTKDNYTFKGWAEGPNTSVVYRNKEIVTDIADKDEIKTLYAVWGAEYSDYTIISDDLAHVQDVLYDIATVTKDDTTKVITIKLDTDIKGRIAFGNNLAPLKTGTFVIDMNGKTVDGGSTREPLCLDNDFNGKITVTGSGKLKTGGNNIIYNGNGFLYFAVAEGYSYFTLKSDGTNVFYTEKNTGNVRMTAVFNRGSEYVLTQVAGASCTLSFDANGGSGTMDDFSAMEGTNITLPENEFTAPFGYRFAGWNTKSNGTGKSYRDEESFTITSDGTLYAKWEKIPATAPTVDPVPAVNLVYGEIAADEKITIIATAATDGEYILTYQWCDENEVPIAGETEASYLIPENITAGNYILYCKVTAERVDNGEKATAGKIVSVAVAKATHTIEVTDLPTAKKIRVNDTLSRSVLTPAELYDGDGNLIGTFEWENPDEMLTESGSYLKNIIFVPEDDNYRNQTFEIEVKASKNLGSTVKDYVRSFNVQFESNGGSYVKIQNIEEGKKATEPEEPTKEGYVFDGWYENKGLTEEYDFGTKVTEGFTLYAKWISEDEEPTEKEEKEDVKEDVKEETEDEDKHECPSADFTDLDVTTWYHLDTDYALANGLFKGVTENTFEPNGSLTRAMLVTVLYRMEGEPATNRSIPFADVDMGAYYGNAVSWAKQNGIVNGITENEFMPDEKITREQIAAIMFRYAVYKGMTAVTMEENLHFDDADEISEYAISAMNWAVGAGLMNGKTESTINPKDNATRAEIAAILHRYIENK